jgi:hypothetical protein
LHKYKGKKELLQELDLAITLDFPQESIRRLSLQIMGVTPTDTDRNILDYLPRRFG